MLQRTSLAASVIIGITCIAALSTDAFAYRGGARVGRVGVHHRGVHRAGIYRRSVYRGTALRRGVAVGTAAAGAYYLPRCGFLPLPPCY